LEPHGSGTHFQIQTLCPWERASPFDITAALADIRDIAPFELVDDDAEIARPLRSTVTALSQGHVLNLEVRAGTMRLQTRGKVQSSLPGKGMGSAVQDRR